jgi:hypothetical protein
MVGRFLNGKVGPRILCPLRPELDGQDVEASSHEDKSWSLRWGDEQAISY